MRKKIIWLTALSVAVVFAVLYHARNVGATGLSDLRGKRLPQGHSGTLMCSTILPRHGRRTMNEVSGRNTSGRTCGCRDRRPKDRATCLCSRTSGISTGTTGWHTHPGQSLIIVTEGTVTAYEGDDPECKPTVYTKGMTFVDPGGDHVHIIRNETELEAAVGPLAVYHVTHA